MPVTNAKSDGRARCHMCGSSDLTFVDAYSNLHRVTSDCQIWSAGGVLACCGGCGLVQTAIDERWVADVARIYREYDIYHQAGGHEQSVFTAAGSGRSRSDVLVARLIEAATPRPTGRLLDIGCGNGSFLRAFSTRLADWSLCGTEVSDKHQATLARIPGVQKIFYSGLRDVRESFDIVSLIHVLEHIPSPVEFLREVHRRLRPGGLLLIQVPDCLQNPFMLLVADHCSHFAVNGLAAIVEACGFAVVQARNDWVAKEVTVVARRVDEAPKPPMPRLRRAESVDIIAGVAWLRRTLEAAECHARSTPFGIFGTAVAATWLCRELGATVSFFVDEDPHRIGGSHLNLPILSPQQVPNGAAIFIALPQPFADRVLHRLEHPGVVLGVPPLRETDHSRNVVS